jgi:hypothetical protein
MVQATKNVLLLLCPCMLRVLPSNSRCLQSHRLAMDLYTTTFNSILYHADPLLSIDSVNNGHSEVTAAKFVTRTNRVTAKQCALRSPCDSYVTQQ